MRFAAGLLVVLATISSVAARVPWTNLVVEDPSLTAEPFLLIGSACPSSRCDWIDGDNRGADGSAYFVRNESDLVPGQSCYMGTLFRQSIWRTGSDGTSERLAYIDEQCGCVTSTDHVHLQISLDQTNGVMYVRLHDWDHCQFDDYEVIRIRGFLTLFDVIQTFTPPPTMLGFRVPYMPEGMPAADHFDTYWGNLTTVGDWSQAHPMKCSYPAAAPHVGDYLTVPDTVPTPVPGRGIYYVTTATYQGATRYGRLTTAGHLRGRDPAVLPACTP